LLLAADVMVKPYAEQGYVQRVLAGWTGPQYDFNAVFPRGQTQSPKIRAFVDFLVERINFEADYMQELCPNHPRSHCTADTAATAAVAMELSRVAAHRPEVAAVPEDDAQEDTQTA
jgi:hypothetical protein